MPKLLLKTSLKWKGVEHELELYESESDHGLSPITQVQAVPFVDENHIVIFKHIDGYYGLPGGTIEKGESAEQALRRELREESACEILDAHLIGYVKDTQVDPPGDLKFQLRYVAVVNPLDQKIQDPDGKALQREIVTIQEVVQKLNWGARGEVLIKLAQRRLRELMQSKE